MEIGTLLSIGYRILCYICNLPSNEPQASEITEYKYSAKEIGMINAVEIEYRKKFPETASSELGFKDFKSPLSKSYDPQRIQIGSNKISSFCGQAINLIIDTINEMNNKSAESVSALPINKANYGHINDAFRVLCIFMIGVLVELSKTNFENRAELKKARKYSRFMEQLSVNLAIRDCLECFSCLESKKTVRDILNEVVRKVEDAKIQIENELEKSNIPTQVQQLNNLIETLITSNFNFYSRVFSSVKEERPQLDIPKFEGERSPNKKWLEQLALSLRLSNKNYLPCKPRSPLSKEHIDNYMEFEKKLIYQNGPFTEWPALFYLNKIETPNPTDQKKGSGIYRKTGEYYQEYRVFGQRLYLMSLLRSSLYYFEQLVLSQGEQVLSNQEAKQLVGNILKQMSSLAISLKTVKKTFVKWGKEHCRELSLTDKLLEDERVWVNHFNAIKTLPDTTEDLLKYIETFQTELLRWRTNSTAPVSFDGQRIIRIVEIVNAQLNPQSPPVFVPSVANQKSLREDDVRFITKKGNVPNFISAVRDWIELFHKHAKQEIFLDFWKKVCYLNTSSFFTNKIQYPLTMRHRIETQREYLLRLQGNLNSAEESLQNWASKTIESLPPLKNQQENLTSLELITGYVKHNEAELNQHASSRVTLQNDDLADKAARLIGLLQGHEKQKLYLADVEAYIRIFHECCFPQGLPYSGQNSLKAQTALNKSLEEGLNTLLGETLSTWKKACVQENSQPAYYQLIAEGLVRLGANPLEWLKGNKDILKELMDQRQFINLFIFFCAQTEMFLSFIQYKALYLGQTLTRLDRKWDEFIQAIMVFSERLKLCIQSDNAPWWQILEGFIGRINKLPTLFSRDPFWKPERFLGARKERFAIWLAVIAWVYQILNETVIDIKPDPDSTTANHALDMQKAMDAYKRLIPEKDTFLSTFNEGFKSYNGLQDAFQAIVNTIQAIAKEREEYISRREARLREELERANEAMSSLQEEVESAQAKTIMAQAEKEQATSQYNALIDRTVVCLLTDALKKVSKQAILSKEERFQAVVDLIYSDPQYAFSLGGLKDVVGWTEKRFKAPFEKLLEQENQPGKEKMLDSSKDAKNSPQLVAENYSPDFFAKRRSHSFSSVPGTVMERDHAH